MTDQQVSQNSFVSQLQADAEKYQDSAAQEDYCAETRENAAEFFLQEYLSSPAATKKFEELALHRQKLGQQTARLLQWQGRGPEHLGQSISDLLDLGDLLQRMQDYLDMTYGPGEFRVFNHHVRGNRNRTVSLTVSWKKDGFENVDSIVENNRQRALERMQRQKENRARGGDEDEDDDAECDELRPSYRGESHRHRESNRDGGRYDDRAPRRHNDGPRNYDNRPRRRYDEDSGPRRQYDDAPRGRRNGDRGDRGPSRGSVPRDPAPRPSRRKAAVSSYDN